MLSIDFRGNRIRAVVCAAVLAMGVSACQTTGGSSSSGQPLSAQEQALADRNSRFGQTVAEGALVGAGIGALAGFLIGGDAESAAIGAGAGALVGAGAGYFVASENQEYATREQALDGQIRQARQLVAEYEQDLAVSRQLVANKQSRVAQLRAQLQAGTVAQAQYQAELESVERSIELLQANVDANETNIDSIQKEIDQFKRDGLNTRALEAERDRYRQLQREQLALLDELVEASRSEL